MSTPIMRRSLFEVSKYGEITVVGFVDKKNLPEGQVQCIGEELFNLINELGGSKILINFSNVEYVSGRMLGKLILLNKKFRDVAGKLVLCNISDDIFKTFEITRIDRLFNIQKDEKAGLAAF